MTHSWTIREATTADIEASVDLRNEVHDSYISAAEWRWKYWDNPMGGSWLFVAEDSGRVIGHLGWARVSINVSGELVVMAHAEDGFVLPTYQRQGIIAALLAKGNAVLAGDGIHEMLGLATPMGKAAALRLGFQSLGPTVRLWMVLNPRAVVEKRTGSPLLAAISQPPLRLLLHLWAGRKRKFRGAGDIAIETADGFDSRFDELWSSIKDGLPLGLWQDAGYLNWRYQDLPRGAVYRPCRPQGRTPVGLHRVQVGR